MSVPDHDRPPSPGQPEGTRQPQDAGAAQRTSATFVELLRNSPFGIYVVDADFRIIEASRGAQRVFGGARSLLGRDLAEVLRILWPEPVAGETIARFRHTLATGEPYASPATAEQRGDTGQFETYDWRIERILLPDGRHGVVCHFYDLTKSQQLQSRLRAVDQRLQLALAAAGMGIWDLDLATDRAVRSLRHDEMFGYAALQPDWGRAIAEQHIIDEDLPIFRAAFDRALEGGVLRVEFRVRWADGSIHRIAPLGRVTYDAAGNPVGIGGVVVDVTEQRRAEEARRVLIQELHHRVKNLFSVAAGIVNLTAANSDSPAAMATEVNGRLLALARAHDLVRPAATGEPALATTLHALVLAVLEPHLHRQATRFDLYGPEVTIGANAATSLALMLHEMATNAAKYGALSTGDGRLAVRWALDGAMLRVDWREQGGPGLAGPPAREGFGRRLARASIETQLGGRIAFDWAAGGLCVTAMVPALRLGY
jgi:PAS domain S-box-containing protein